MRRFRQVEVRQYVRQPTSDVLVPSQRLVGFARVTLNPGQSQTVHLSCPFRHLP
ncbi:MAG: hypothetical protein E6I37_09920 [Chloroflexi bacterium]|nr:MAG: hypothetical protein E6I37_09920 [Chloroflexota bacterium]